MQAPLTLAVSQGLRGLLHLPVLTSVRYEAALWHAAASRPGHVVAPCAAAPPPPADVLVGVRRHLAPTAPRREGCEQNRSHVRPFFNRGVVCYCQVMSAYANAARRDAVRATWMRFRHPHLTFRVAFVIGACRPLPPGEVTTGRSWVFG